MSKIQDALRKIQGTGSVAQSGEATGLSQSADDSPTSSVPIGKIQPELDDTGIIIQPSDGGLVVVDRDGLRDAGYLAPQEQERHLADQYRQLKRPLIGNVMGPNAMQEVDSNLVMVTSALPGDGKTFNCINLALSIATEKDVSVLLVDADVAKPHVSELFGILDRPGLINVLNGESSVESTTLRTDIPGLSLLPAGSHDVHATELLASKRMNKLVHRLSTSDQNRIVIFDSPPLLVTSEASALAASMGQIVMIVRSGKTPQRAVVDALTRLDENKAINLVLNDSDSAAAHGQYGGYGYGYGMRQDVPEVQE